jgi:hypothetical protein
VDSLHGGQGGQYLQSSDPLAHTSFHVFFRSCQSHLCFSSLAVFFTMSVFFHYNNIQVLSALHYN